MNLMDTTRAFYEAFGTKQWTRLRGLLSDDFTFRGFLARFDSPDSFIEAMKQMPFEGNPEGSKFIVGDGHVAHVFVWRMTAPTEAEIPMCEVIEIRDGKVASSQLFYDSKQFPVPA